MTARMITPVLFAAAIQTAQRFRVEGSSVTAAALRACFVEHLDEAWSIPLAGFLNDSPQSAEAWAAIQFANALELTATKIEGAPDHA